MRTFREFRFHSLRPRLQHPSQSHTNVARCAIMSANTAKQPAGAKNAKDKPVVEKKELKILMLHGQSAIHVYQP